MTANVFSNTLKMKTEQTHTYKTVHSSTIQNIISQTNVYRHKINAVTKCEYIRTMEYN